MYINWTPQAIECYLLGCNCKNCIIYQAHLITSGTCRMKFNVIENVKKIGIPTKNDLENYENRQN